MLRKAVEPLLLKSIQTPLEQSFAQYLNIPPAEFQRHLASQDPVARDFWQQIQLGHMFDRTFKPAAGFSFFEIVRSSGLWSFTALAFPESLLEESSVCNCRRITDSDVRQFWDRPIEFHIDAQFFYDEKLSINFWTPLVPCGLLAPGLKVIPIGVHETRTYLEYNPDGYDPGPKDFARMHKFRCSKLEPFLLQKHGFLSQQWAPQFEVGDILAFTNFTLHATHFTDTMTEPRISVEVRVDLPDVQL